MCAFGVAFGTALFFFTEINTKTSGYSAVVLFKRGTKIDTPDPESEKQDRDANSSATASISQYLKSNDVFTFSHVSYTIPVGKNEMKRLLEDVSGYVVPGRLTALMGESGAGKVN